MKSKLALVMFIGLVSTGLALAQSGTSEGDAATAQATNDAAATAEQTTADADMPAAEPAQSADAAQTNAVEPAETNAVEPAETNAVEPAEAEETAQATEAPQFVSSTGEEAEVSQEPVIPLIQFQDVELTTAIENLARQAKINYILDPKVGYGQPDERGVVHPPPTISIRWEKITASQALAGLLETYGLQLIEDPKTGIGRVTIKDPKAPEPLFTKIIQLKFASPSNIIASVKGTLTDPRSKVIGDVRTSQLVVVATEKEQDAVAQLVASLDLRTKQVLIETKLIETRINPSTMKGIDWSGTLQAQHFTFGNNSLPGVEPTPPVTYTDPITGAPNTLPGTPGTIGGILSDPKLLANTMSGLSPETFFLNADGVAGVLSFLNTYADGKVVSAPRTVTLDNEKSTIEVGTLYPIVNVTAGTANTTGGSQITYSNLTVNLEVTPRISANDFVNLKVRPRVMRLGPKFTTTIAGLQNQVDSFLTRSLETSVLIPSGNTLVMGGLIQDIVGKQNTKIPVLGDLPIIGLAFRHDAKTRDKNNLVIFITPTIVQDQDFQPNHSTYLKTPYPTDDEVEPEWSAWDSGKPYDWSDTESSKHAVYSHDPLASQPSDE